MATALNFRDPRARGSHNGRMRRPASLRRLLVCAVAATAVGAASTAHAALELPQNLSKGDRERALRTLAFGSAPKILSDPFPLGGYSGLEVGLSLESLPTQEIGRLGSGVLAPQQEATYAKLSVGKGLYEDVDVFLSFTPYQSAKTELIEYGGMLRWSFYQGAQFPLTLSAVVHLGGLNVQDKMTAQTIGADLVGGLNVNDVALYVGVGPIRAQGTFLGGDSGVTDGDKSSQTEESSGFHQMIGASVRFGSAFLAAQVDRHTQTVLSAKVGLRF